MADIFISYAKENYPDARKICDDLEQEGFKCWIAPREIFGSTDYLVEIPAAIKSSRVLLLVLSTHSMASPQVYREVHTAADAKLPILPIRIENVPIGQSLEFALTGVQWVDAFPRVEPALANIRNQLRRLFERHEIPLPPPGPTRIVRLASSIGTWGIIAGITTLVAVLIHGHWYNLVPPAEFPVALLARPVPLVLVLAAPLSAAVMQYVAHAKPSALLTMNALFGFRQKGAALVRTGVAIALLTALAVAARRIPPTVTIAFESRSSQQLSGMTRLDECEPAGYPETQGMYVAQIRVGAYNPEYSMRASVEFTAPNSLELCQIWADAGFTAKKRPLTPQLGATMRPHSQWVVELRSSENESTGLHRALFTLIHSRTATLSGSDTRLVAGVAGYPAATAALHVSEADWR